MRDRLPYWKDHPVYMEHFPLATLNHESGKWEMFCVDYKPGHIDYHGGKFVEFYWCGDHQESFDWDPVTNPKQMLEQFVDFWLDENRS